MSDEQIKVYKIYHPSHSGKNHCVVSDLIPAIDELKQLEIDEDILIECCLMTQKEMDKLPEFEGW